MALIFATHPFASSFASSDGFGKFLFLALFLLSLTSWWLILYKSWLLRQARHHSLAFQKAQVPQSHPLTWKANLSLEEAPNSFAAIYQRIKGHTVSLLNNNRRGEEESVTLSCRDIQLIEEKAWTEITCQRRLLERHLYILSTIVSLAPFLGLLGTIWGILTTFSQLQNPSGGSVNQMVLSGLSMALVTTVLGLIVAIPALIGYSALKQSLQNFCEEMAAFTQEVLTGIELHYRPQKEEES